MTEQTLITIILFTLLLLSISLQIIIGVLFQNMINETDNMSATDNKILKQCKLKFVNCYQMNQGVPNVPVFVDKFINRIKLGWFTIPTLGHLSGQLMLLSVFTAGVGACRGIIKGSSITEILPFYIISFSGLYLYFSISSIVDIKGRTRILKVNIVDYLENHMVTRLSIPEMEMSLAEDSPLKKDSPLRKDKPLKKEKGVKAVQKEETEDKVFSKLDQRELEELLREFLA